MNCGETFTPVLPRRIHAVEEWKTFATWKRQFLGSFRVAVDPTSKFYLWVSLTPLLTTIERPDLRSKRNTTYRAPEDLEEIATRGGNAL